MSNTYEQALNAVQSDPELLSQLLAASSNEEKSAVLTAAGVPIPTKADGEAYLAEHPEDSEQTDVEGTAQYAMETGWC